MTPEERFAKIDETLERIAARQDKFEIEFELQRNEANLRLKKLEEMQIVLTDAQNSTWAAINQLTANIDKLTRGPRANGHGE
jgi:hypothetical protein